ncbi:uncharacterized protein LOC120158965 [Hibiscus syriacus]|uniref:uncharacterized protein LOC120158965 n=1 Tax=Hibiscus syriacus TaxID=106335 RepID=UPI001920E543|nr:uncharacterized protein LOC120158965 [Hibiscus syriacus]XP_039025611.1 uncharacterized protein LOC120158965 [Hibiscus syriacus]
MQGQILPSDVAIANQSPESAIRHPYAAVQRKREERSMLEDPTSTAPDAAPIIKRYTPPNQRNRSLGRRKSGDWFHWTNNVYGNDSEKNLGVASRNNLVGDAGSSGILNEDHHRPTLIPLEGCSRSDASRL